MKYSVKLLFASCITILISFDLSLANNCTDLEMGRMIKRGLSDEVIDTACSEKREKKIDEKPIIKKENIKPKPIAKKKPIPKPEEKIKGETPAYWRLEEPHGLGFGLTGIGAGVYYDYNFSDFGPPPMYPTSSSSTGGAILIIKSYGELDHIAFKESK